MKVVDEEPAWWFLFESEDGLFLDVNCGHSAVGYSILIRMSDEESASYASEGRDYLDRLAHAVHDPGPGSAMQRRDVTPQYGRACSEAIKVWRVNHEAAR